MKNDLDELTPEKPLHKQVDKLVAAIKEGKRTSIPIEMFSLVKRALDNDGIMSKGIRTSVPLQLREIAEQQPEKTCLFFAVVASTEIIYAHSATKKIKTERGDEIGIPYPTFEYETMGPNGIIRGRTLISFEDQDSIGFSLIKGVPFNLKVSWNEVEARWESIAVF
ncbi:MAG: hypothetical protein EPGJADBJ_01483 [Saprospiraceae bacterium]|nr:hypothetical protein [Saprospiraceae bacterium]